MKLTRGALTLLAAWVLTLLALTVFVQQQLRIDTDLRLFLPSPTTPQQQLLLEEIGEGPAARILVLALQGASTEELADTSRDLAAALRDSEQFTLVTNGELSLDDVDDDLLVYRYLLTDTFDTQPLDETYLRTQLQQRARDLASPAGTFLEPWLPADPTLELLNVLQRLQPMQEPRREYDVWFDRAGERALLLAQTAAPAFDPERQRQAITTLHQSLAALTPQDNIELIISGPGQFSVVMEEGTRGEAQALGTAATVGMLALLLIGYRNIGALLLSALPLASAGLAGLAAVGALFGTVHGITLAFGFTLIGVAQDYPLHMLSHQQPGHSPWRAARSLWPTLATSVASTCIAYLTFAFSGVVGLAQVACFSIAGLAVASLATRYLLPALMAESSRDHGDSPAVRWLHEHIAQLPRPRWAAVAALLAAMVGIWQAPQPFWENDLGKLTPLPTALLQQDQQLRSQLGTPDVRYLLVLESADTDAALLQLNALSDGLDALMDAGAITGYDHAARYVPPTALQLQRQQALPDAATLQAALDRAVADTPFLPDAFTSFLQDVERARTLPPLTIEQLLDSPMGAGIDVLLPRRDAATTALVTFSGVNDAQALQAFAQELGTGMTLLDTKQASETLVANQRSHILACLAVAVVLLAGVVSLSLRHPARIYRVLAPVALTTILIIGVLQAAGVSLTLFHLIALMLAAGLGLDYSLFFEHSAHDPAEHRRTLHAVTLCSISTLMVFALLALSSLPVLQAIGITVTLGVLGNFLLALALTRPQPA